MAAWTIGKSRETLRQVNRQFRIAGIANTIHVAISLRGVGDVGAIILLGGDSIPIVIPWRNGKIQVA